HAEGIDSLSGRNVGKSHGRRGRATHCRYCKPDHSSYRECSQPRGRAMPASFSALLFIADVKGMLQCLPDLPFSPNACQTQKSVQSIIENCFYSSQKPMLPDNPLGSPAQKTCRQWAHPL